MTVPNPPASVPQVELEGRYRLGPALTEDTSLDYWFNYEYPDGTIVASSEPVGWERVDYITPLDQVGGRDGALVGPQSVAPRTVEVEALIVAPTAVLLRQHIARVRALLGPSGFAGNRPAVVWEQHDFATNRRLALVVRPAGGFVPRVIPGFTTGGLAVSLSFSLVAATPWKYQAGVAESNQVGLPNPALIGGRTYSKTYSYTYGSAVPAGGSMVVINNGDLATFPIFTITGPVDFPIITNVTTGQSFQINRNMSAGEVVTIDSALGTVTPASVRLIGRPFTLVPGGNTISWRSASGVYQAAALLRLEWRSTSR